jgi:type IV fimbrial biogenesis protein FimT
MKRHTGFTLTELMVTVAIVAILLAIGVPSYRYVTNSNRMSAEVNSLLGDLQYARAEAIREGQTVSVCVSSDGVTCSGANNWQNGWIVFPDPAGGGSADVPASVLRVAGAFAGATPDTFTPSNPISSVTFNRDGFAQAAGNAAFTPTTFTLHEKTASITWTRCLLISVVGLIQTETAVNPQFGPCI